MQKEEDDNHCSLGKNITTGEKAASKQVSSLLKVLKHFCWKVYTSAIVIGIPLLLTLYSLPATGVGNVFQRIFTSTDFTALMMSVNISLIIELFGIRGSDVMEAIRNILLGVTIFFMAFGLFLTAAIERGDRNYFLERYLEQISNRYDAIILVLMLLDYLVISYDEVLTKK